LYIGIGTGEHPLVKKLAPLWRFISKRLSRKQRSKEAAFTPKVYPPKPGPDGILRTGTMADTYHGKVVPLETARQLVTIREPIAQPLPETVIPFAKARDLILTHPDHLIALDCPCRVSRPSPCLPLDVCLIVGEPFASFVHEHHPERSRQISQEEAVEILRAEDERGHVHHAFFKDAILGRFYAICSCCDCCCGAMQAQRRGTPMLISSGYVCRVNESVCIGCGECGEYCQFHALSLGDGYSVVDFDKCMGCGVCVSKCAQEALALEQAPQKGEPLEITAML
jgi:ferredoxin